MTQFTANPSENRFFEEKFDLRRKNSNSIFKSFLSYELTTHSSDNCIRDLLIVKDGLQVRNVILNDSSKIQLENLIKYIDIQIYSRRKKTFAYHKVAYQLLYENFELSNVVVAINIHGCVPVYLTSHTVNLLYKGEAITARIAIRPGFDDLTDKETQAFDGSYPPEKYQLLKQDVFNQLLQYNLPLFFRKHYEDIEDILGGIINYSNVYYALLRAKLIEEVVGTSIKVKIDALTKIAHQLSEEDRSTLNLAKAKRSLFLYYSNEIYRIFGLNAKAKYDIKCGEQLEICTEDGLDGKIATYLHWLLANKKKYEILRDNSLSGIDPINLPSWVNQAYAFFRFLLSLRASIFRQGLKTPLEKGNVYIPNVSENDLHEYHKHNTKSQVKILDLDDQDGIEQKYLLWLSDLVILPKDTYASPDVQEAKSLANQMVKRVEQEEADLVVQLKYAKRLHIVQVLQGWIRGLGKDLAKAICEANKDFYAREENHRGNFYYRKTDLRGFTDKPSVLNNLDKYNNARTLWLGKEITENKKPFKFLKVSKNYPKQKLRTKNIENKGRNYFPKSNKYQGNILDVIEVLLPDYSKEAQKEIFLEVIKPWLSKK